MKKHSNRFIARYQWFILALLLMLPVMCSVVHTNAATLDQSYLVLATSGLHTSWERVYNPLIKEVDTIFVPALSIIGAAGTLYCVFLGVKYAKAEDPQEHEKAKKAIINAAIGVITLFLLMIAMHATLPVIDHWLYTDMQVQKGNQ